MICICTSACAHTSAHLVHIIEYVPRAHTSARHAHTRARHTRKQAQVMHERMHMFIYMSIHMSIHMSVHMGIHIGIHVSIYMSTRMSTHMYIHACLSTLPKKAGFPTLADPAGPYPTAICPSRAAGSRPRPCAPLFAPRSS